MSGGAGRPEEGEMGSEGEMRALEALLREGSPQARVAFAARWVMTLLREGSAARALKAGLADAARAASGGWAPPERPETWGTGPLPGAEALAFEPYELRGITEVAAALLAEAAEAHPPLTSWLFQGLKLWGSHERGLFWAALGSVAIPDARVAEAVGELVAFAEATPSDQRASMLRDLFEGACDAATPLLALLDALAQHPGAAASLTEALYGSELGSPLSGDVPPWLDPPAPATLTALRRLCEDPQPLVAVVAVDLLARLPAEAPALAPSLGRLFLRGDLPPRLLQWAARAALVGGLEGALEAPIRQTLGGPVDPGAADLLRSALARLRPATLEVTRLSGGGAGVDTRDDLGGPLAFAGGRLFVAYQQVTARTPGEDWATDREQVGLIEIEPESGEARRIPLPLSLGVQATGAAGAKRRFRLATAAGGRLYAVLSTPFYDARGWGTDARVFAFDPASGSWSPWTPEGGDGPPLDPAALRAEADVPAAGAGLLLLWTREDGALRTTWDHTPYHLDDWTQRPEVLSAQRSVEACHRRLGWAPWTVTPVGPGEGEAGDLDLSRGKATLRLPRALPPPGEDLRWVEAAVAPGRAWAALRAWVEAPDGGGPLERLLVLPLPKRAAPPGEA